MRPLAGALVTLRGSPETLAGASGADLHLGARPVTWTRALQSFSGTRWQCWVAHVRDSVPGITWEQFRDDVLRYNPHLNDSGRIFQASAAYLLPEQSAGAPYAWTRALQGFSGTRWQCWVAYVRDSVPGITWEQFRDDVLRYNPHLNADGRLFLPDRAYLLPQVVAQPRAEIQLRAGPDGAFTLSIPASGELIEITAACEGYAPALAIIAANGSSSCTLVLSPADARASGTVRSALTTYARIDLLRRAIIDAGLAMLGDDRQTYDALPPVLQQLCFGSRYVTQPSNRYYKDIVCADVVSIALRAAGCRLWPGNTHLADYYHPARAGGALVTVEDQQLLPGDILVFGNGAPEARAAHVALYVGPFYGRDRSGVEYALPAGFDVVEGSILFAHQGRPLGTGVIGITLAQCRQGRRGYSWMRAVRLRELQRAA
jgi:hypothetical protein